MAGVDLAAGAVSEFSDDENNNFEADYDRVNCTHAERIELERLCDEYFRRNRVRWIEFRGKDIVPSSLQNWVNSPTDNTERLIGFYRTFLANLRFVSGAKAMNFFRLFYMDDMCNENRDINEF